MSDFLYGKIPIREAFRAGRRQIHKFFYAGVPGSDPQLAEVLAWAQERQIRAEKVERSWLEAKFPNGPTQGWAAEVSGYPYLSLDAGLSEFPKEGPASFLALDQIQDPQNMGAILRTAECCGVQGVILPKDRSCPITPAVGKASAGAVEFLSIFQVPNLVRALGALKEVGFWVVGTEAEEAQNALNFEWPERSVLVLGSEGKGMRRLVRENCDFLIHLPLAGRISSLNVSAATAACLFLKQVDRSKKLAKNSLGK